MAIIQHIAPSSFAVTVSSSSPTELFPNEVFSPNANLLAPLTGVPSCNELSSEWLVTGKAGDFDMYTLLTDCMDGQLQQGDAYLFRPYDCTEDPKQGQVVAAYVSTDRLGANGRSECVLVAREFYRDKDGTIRLKARDLETPDICGPDSHGEPAFGITIAGVLYSNRPARHFVRLSMER